MHIVLLVLKIIGIVLGSILGLLLALLLMILFVPIRYRIQAEKKDSIQCQIRVNWLFRGINCLGEYTGERFIYRLKILGITVKSNLSEKKKKKNRETEKKRKSINKKTRKVSEKKEKEDYNKQKENTETVLQEKASSKIKEYEEKEQIQTKTEIYDENRTIAYAGIDEKRKTAEEEEFTFFEKVSAFLSKKYQDFIKKINCIKKKIKNMLISMKKGISKIKVIWSFLTEEENKAGFRVCMEAVKKGIKHIKPKVLKGYLRFGTEDPCNTGQILGVIAMFYGTFGRFFDITPDFEKAVLEYSIYAKGRIRIFTVGKIVLQLWFSKELKKLIENFEHCKEELENGR